MSDRVIERVDTQRDRADRQIERMTDREIERKRIQRVGEIERQRDRLDRVDKQIE